MAFEFDVLIVPYRFCPNTARGRFSVFVHQCCCFYCFSPKVGVYFVYGLVGRLYTYHYTVTTRLTPALRWAAMRAILMFHNCEGQSHKTRSERRAEADSNRCPSAYQPNALPLGQTGSPAITPQWRTTDLCSLFTSILKSRARLNKHTHTCCR